MVSRLAAQGKQPKFGKASTICKAYRGSWTGAGKSPARRTIPQLEDPFCAKVVLTNRQAIVLLYGLSMLVLALSAYPGYVISFSMAISMTFFWPLSSSAHPFWPAMRPRQGIRSRQRFRCRAAGWTMRFLSRYTRRVDRRPLLSDLSKSLNGTIVASASLLPARRTISKRPVRSHISSCPTISASSSFHRVTRAPNREPLITAYAASIATSS